jgi:hypothetical protein
MTYRKPAVDDVSPCALRLDAPEGTIAYGLMHPQLGGYCAVSVVEFTQQTGAYSIGTSGQAIGRNGCFHIHVWHDGEFPIADGEPHQYHYCDATQLVDFGLEVLALQAKHQRHEDRSIQVNETWVRETIAKLQALVVDTRHA